VLFGPDEYDGVLTVTLSSIKYRKNFDAFPHETTCTLDVYDHPNFISKPSYVRFDLTAFHDVGGLSRALSNRDIKPFDDASPELVDRLIKGLLTSKRTPQDCKIPFI